MKLKTIGRWALGLAAFYAQVALASPVNPIELLFRPLLKGPMVVPVNSAANAYAGLTTLNSGSATATFSSTAIASGSILNLAVQAALAAGYTTQGRTQVLSGIATGTVSTTAVYSGQVINLAFETATNVASGVGKGIRVDSIVDGVSFAITATDSFGYPGTINAMWRIPQAVPEGLKVNTVAAGYAIVGWADGQARPVDTVVMWETRRSN